MSDRIVNIRSRQNLNDADAGAGIKEQAGGGFEVSVDNITIEIVDDKLQLKSGGVSSQIATDSITHAMLKNDAVETHNVKDANITIAKLDPSVLQVASVSLSSADILALRATPKELVAAPGDGKVLQFVGAVMTTTFVTAAYTESADNMAVRYENGSGAKVSADIEATGFIDVGADTATYVAIPTGCLALVNKALVLHNIGDGEYAAGSGTMVVKVYYRTITL